MEEKEMGSVVFTSDSIVLKPVGDKKIVFGLRQRFDLETVLSLLIIRAKPGLENNIPFGVTIFIIIWKIKNVTSLKGLSVKLKRPLI